MLVGVRMRLFVLAGWRGGEAATGTRISFG